MQYIGVFQHILTYICIEFDSYLSIEAKKYFQKENYY